MLVCASGIAGAGGQSIFLLAGAGSHSDVEFLPVCLSAHTIDVFQFFCQLLCHKWALKLCQM